MEVAILHYHLNPGGVTRVIETQIKGLISQPGHLKLSLISGSAGQNFHTHIPVHTSDLLFYNEKEDYPEEVIQKVNSVINFLKSVTTEQTVLHCHNSNLGKNPVLTLAIYELALQGYRILNHIHDFPEDRPVNLLRIARYQTAYGSHSTDEILYPSLSNYHFVVLTSCDYERIASKGIPPSRIHLLPNCIMPSGMDAGRFHKPAIRETLGIDPEKILCTYPVRPIARKNIGEVILLAAIFSDTCRFAITLAPLNPLELPLYSKWKIFCEAQSIPVVFEAAEKVNFNEIMAASDFCISTSIREGFGMTFLEPWQAGVPVIGRELPCVINDLKSKGLIFPLLYPSILVSSGNIPVDYGHLSADHQEQIVHNIIGNSDAKQQIVNDNPFLEHLFDPVSHEVIENNRSVIQQHFSTDQYGRELFRIYHQVSG
jgi:glycosyltransferase involved in cell wall biosynthesis